MSKLFGNVHHTAFVVPDIEQALLRVAASGVGPSYLMSRISGPGRYRGELQHALISAAFVFSGDTLWEFISTHDRTPSSYLEYLDKHPEGGMHHVAYTSADFDQTIADAAAAGVELRMVQEYFSGDSAPFEIYMEPANTENPLLVQFMLPGLLSDFFQKIKESAANWDGSQPIRDALPLLPPGLV